MIPDSPHLQNSILGKLAEGGELPGHEIRDYLNQSKKRVRSGPAFYQLMARMEKSGLVKGWYAEIEVNGHVVRERRYKINAKGRRALTEAISFYERIARAIGMQTSW